MVCHQIRLRGDSKSFFVVEKKKTKGTFEYVGVHSRDDAQWGCTMQ